MGASMSTDTAKEIKDVPHEQHPRSMSGRKQSPEKQEDTSRFAISTIETDEEPSVSSEDESAEEDNDLEYDAADEDEEEDEEWNERLAVLRDARQLKQWADFYAHPEAPVEVDPLAKARNYFNRPSAPRSNVEEEMERIRILQDAKQLKQFAVDYMHPELPVKVTDPLAGARNYFGRASAEPQESKEEADERARILEDAAALKKLAVDYMHPELPVKTTDPLACGRNYFDRPSAPQQELDEEAEERAQVLADAAALKQLAVDYMHPELPVKTSDPFACGRNYFSRPAADEFEDEDDMDERDDIVADAMKLKELAIDYMHPEKPVAVDPLASCRNYFDRASAEPQESKEEADERARILEDAAALKKLAVDYLHPELPVKTTDPLACGRNYFDRPSAPQQELDEEAEERARVLEDAAALKQLAVDYMHPELPVKTTDPFACGRNYFSRPAADEYEDEDDMDERDDIVADAMKLKELAIDYMHPEKPVVVDSLASCRNYFDRASAEPQETAEEAEERSRILEDAAALKKLAVDYMHPELPVKTTDPLACGRNYFDRPSAPQQELDEEAEERAQVLADAAALKQLAVDYMHPELPVKTTDPFACGRNYFSRPAADEYEDEDDMDERDDIMEDMMKLKELAIDYMHPEKPVAVDPLASCRNYFDRASAELQESKEEADERARILEDAAALKKLAVDYMHPELPVKTTDPLACGRNYFDRPSAPQQELDEEAEERARVLADAAALKQLAVDYMHPEFPVKTTDPFACGRNYFSRPSADHEAETEERELILAEAAALKQLAEDYQHPERSVQTTDPFACGRNYFDRPSAPGHEEHIHSHVAMDHDEHVYHDHHGYHYYDDEHHHHHHHPDDLSHGHSDHFEMEEDFSKEFASFRQSLVETEPFKGDHPQEEIVTENEQEGKLSRSPSSVMLFDGGAEVN